MSAMSSSAPVQPPETKAPVALPPPVKKSRKWVSVLVVLVVIAGAALVLRQLRTATQPQQVSIAGIRTSQAFVGPMEVTLRLGGSTSARSFANITAPIMRGPGGGAMVLLELAKSGSRVKKGEVVAVIDSRMLQDRIDDLRDTVNGAANEVGKRGAEQKVEWEAMQQTLRVAKASVDKAKLDFSAGEVRTEVERELLKLSVDEAEARYNQQTRDVAFRKASQDAELKILQISLELQRRRINRFAHDLERFTIRTSMDGLVVMANVFRGGEMGQVQLGDQVMSGQQIMKVVDPATMQVDSSVSQSDSGLLRVGQKVHVGLDAFPDLKFSGRVHSLGALAVGGGRENFFVRSVPVKVTIEGADPRLIPDLSAHCNVVLEAATDQLQIPASAVYTEQGKTFVSVKRGEQFEKREVAPGKRNNTYVAIESGLKAGEEVRLASN